ncbi:PRTRC system protein B [Sphingomonas sp. RHCKR47]|uniref:PRTRC system protein B n=1 Tax=Sphingomonas citricola TaxID=2862498 RepID=UPI001CA58CA7|nr:PRTRC system protein B [Sphingomonas citricola]MBW6524441.1 PRTRC system protein B [Sphingomonas citricola]
MTIATGFEPTGGGMALTNAILLYQSEGVSLSDPYRVRRADGLTFASIHAVEQVDGCPVIVAGAPLSRAHLRQWTEALGRNKAPEILPENVLVSHADVLAWWVPAQVRTSYFALSHPPEGLRALADRIVLPLPYPAHLFVATRNELGVYALAASERPVADTPVLHSPVLNVFINGQLCWGNIARPKAITAASIPEFERAVFASWSTHPNPGQEATVTGRGGLVKLWDDLAVRKATRFPAGRLKPFGSVGRGKVDQPVTLGALIKRSVRA